MRNVKFSPIPCISIAFLLGGPMNAETCAFGVGLNARPTSDSINAAHTDASTNSSSSGNVSSASNSNSQASGSTGTQNNGLTTATPGNNEKHFTGTTTTSKKRSDTTNALGNPVDASQSQANEAEPIGVRISNLDSAGTDKFNFGVERVAIGITQLSLAAQDQQTSGETADAHTAQLTGMQNIVSGSQDISTGREIVGQANAIRLRENSLSSAGGASTYPLHELAFSAEKAPASTQEALSQMEQSSHTPASALIEAVNQGGTDQLLSFAATASGLQEADLFAIIPNFGSPEAPLVAKEATTSFGPRSPGLIASRTPIPKESGAQLRTPASISKDRPHLAPSGKDEDFDLRPLSADQFMGSLAPTAIDEFGNPLENLFHRVRNQYTKRQTLLGPR
ncbi:MAG: hypothetical protein ACXVCI_00545 [Bdellovibrionota bacterium]